MVGPASSEERASVTRKIKLGFTVLIGLSAGLVTLQGDPSPAVIGGAVLGGMVVGWLLIWYTFPDTDTAPDRDDPDRKRERF